MVLKDVLETTLLSNCALSIGMHRHGPKLSDCLTYMTDEATALKGSIAMQEVHVRCKAREDGICRA